MEQKEILNLMQKFCASDLSVLEIRADGIRMEKQICTPSAIAAAPMRAAEPDISQEITPDTICVKAPLVGVFYAAPSPDAPPFVKVGDRVEKGQPLCVLEAMKVMNELNSPAQGVITKIGAKDGDVISFEQLLFEVTP